MDNPYAHTVAQLAKQAAHRHEVPVGAVVIDSAGQIIGRGYNLTHTRRDSTEHAEVRALKSAFRKRGDWRLDDCSLVVNLEPCLMCLGAMAQARITKLTYFLPDPAFGSVESRLTKPQLKKLFPRLTIEKVPDQGETKAFLQSFFQKLRTEKSR